MATAGASTWRGQKHRVFQSVFDTDVSQPTPHTTPSLRSTEKGQPFGGPPPPTTQFPSPSISQKALGLAGVDPLGREFSPPSVPITDQVRWDRAWHAVTSRIQLPPSVAAEDSFGDVSPELQDPDHSFYDNIRLVLYPERYAPHAAHTEDLLSWHTQQARQHLVHHVLPLISACGDYADEAQGLLGSIRTLEAAHRQYLYGLSLIVRGLDGRTAEMALDKFRRDLHAIISNAVSPSLATTLRNVLGRLMRVLLKMDPVPADPLPSPSRHRALNARRAEQHVETARREFRQLVEALHHVGLAGEKFQVLFAEMMDALMAEYVQTSFAGLWAQTHRQTTTRTTGGCIASLCDWVENHYARLAVEVFNCLGSCEVAWKDVEDWKEIAVGRLAVMRMHELFDMVLHWPESKDALEDLRIAVTTPQRRLQLTDTFAAALQKRLLHPGRSTLDILQVYISMIRTFHALDHSKVLLGRVVHSLQLYLCQRDDAIRIVVTGLLSNPEDADTEAGRGKLVELGVLLNDPAQQHRSVMDDEELDWDDMEWLPDPVDAGINYKRPKTEDVIGTLINALGSRDIFIKEFQNIIAERLLSKQADFPQEIKVLNLLKKRFGEHALQGCDVMIKDIQDSRRVDAVVSRNIRAAIGLGSPDRRAGAIPSYHTRILSRLFWPTLDREHFLLPRPIAEVQRRYDVEYEQLKSSRKLTWLNNLGTATVQLDLQDRSIHTDCKTYEAAVIYAFREEEDNSDAPVQRTVAQLEEMLQMDDDTIRLALRFWASQRIAREVAPDTFVVLERLEDDDDATAGASAGASRGASGPPEGPARDIASPSKSKGGGLNAQERERRQVYWQFIVGMLTNSSPAMPLAQIAMMMKMLIPDGFPWGNEELQMFLAEKIAAKELELAGGKYRLPKK
ncbi:Cullin family protein [Sodiomyces alkalinus F11]|uniref:Anaphase-promoting complex subunit 2 n=1 Tax=Sodiomyces alkalinus (strain CBS 110278 / VKM F-3762 / F11) TaxID=1314773 RepID=A0A3N2PR41_SODAK|nr:Cullin family protein [Sodiomyces alkalinus F11]ROT36940.1 Cullin family protein [Sodiomyces alkalinus F11]